MIDSPGQRSDQVLQPIDVDLGDLVDYSNNEPHGPGLVRGPIRASIYPNLGDQGDWIIHPPNDEELICSFAPNHPDITRAEQERHSEDRRASESDKSDYTRLPSSSDGANDGDHPAVPIIEPGFEQAYGTAGQNTEQPPQAVVTVPQLGLKAVEHEGEHSVLPGLYVCDLDGCTAAPFEYQYIFHLHKSLHSQNRSYLCPHKGCSRGVIGKGFRHKNGMIRHQLALHRKIEMIRPVHQSCGEYLGYLGPVNLLRHMEVCHFEEDRDDGRLGDVLAPGQDSRGRRRRLPGSSSAKESSAHTSTTRARLSLDHSVSSNTKLLYSVELSGGPSHRAERQQNDSNQEEPKYLLEASLDDSNTTSVGSVDSVKPRSTVEQLRNRYSQATLSGEDIYINYGDLKEELSDDMQLDDGHQDRIFDDAISITSVPSLVLGTTLSSYNSPEGPVNVAVDELAILLIKDVELQRLFKAALELVTPEKFERNLHELLQLFAIQLKGLAQGELNKATVLLVYSQCRQVANRIRRMYLPDSSEAIEEFNMLSAQEPAKADRLESFLQSFQQAHPLHEAQDAKDGQSSDDSDMGDPEQPSLSNLDLVKSFVLSGAPFQNFKIGLERFLHPESKVQEQGRSFSLGKRKSESLDLTLGDDPKRQKVSITSDKDDDDGDEHGAKTWTLRNQDTVFPVARLESAERQLHVAEELEQYSDRPTVFQATKSPLSSRQPRVPLSVPLKSNLISNRDSFQVLHCGQQRAPAIDVPRYSDSQGFQNQFQSQYHAILKVSWERNRISQRSKEPSKDYSVEVVGEQEAIEMSPSSSHGTCLTDISRNTKERSLDQSLNKIVAEATTRRGKVADNVKEAIDVLSSPDVHRLTKASARLQAGLRLIRRRWKTWCRPNVRLGFRRIEWTCDCGDELYGDFNNAIPEALYHLAAMLNSPGSSTAQQAFAIAHTNQIPSPANQQARTPFEQSMQEQGRQQTRLQKDLCTVPAPCGTLTQKFLELCVNTGKFQKSLGEIDITRVHCDRDLFTLVKQRYDEVRGHRTKLFLLEPVGVQWVQFSLEERHRVGILMRPMAVPPKEEVDRETYEYAPCPLDSLPPVPDDIFLHHLNNPGPHRRPLWLHRLPKKRNDSLLRCSDGLVVGWGVLIIEGPNWLAVWALAFGIVFVSGVFAIVWSVFREDVSGGFGVAGWLASVLTLGLMGCFSKWSQE